MQDSAVVAAVVAGDADGFVAAYDQYATSLYGCCRRVLPGPEAAEAVLDTFLIATAKLDGLRDPDRLGPWLHAVARNECLRRLGPGGEIPAAADLGDEPLETPPADLGGRVVTMCADNTPAGRAHRMSVAHRAGVFGPAGFPKTIGPNGPRWWRVLRQRVRRYPGVALAVAVAATLAATAGITVVMAGGGSHRPQASGLGGDVPASASSTPSGGTGRVPSPARTAPVSALPTSPAALAGATSAAPPAGRVTPGPTASPSGTSPSPSPSPSASSSPAQGYLLVAPARLVLTSKSGTPASGIIRLTALNGPVPHYTVRVAADPGRVKVAPAGGSLPMNGTVAVTVTVTSKVALTTHIVVEPGNLTVTVVYKPQPAPTPSPSPSPKA
jgi:Sigma-70 region 2